MHSSCHCNHEIDQIKQFRRFGSWDPTMFWINRQYTRSEYPKGDNFSTEKNVELEAVACTGGFGSRPVESKIIFCIWRSTFLISPCTTPHLICPGFLKIFAFSHPSTFAFSIAERPKSLGFYWPFSPFFAVDFLNVPFMRQPMTCKGFCIWKVGCKRSGMTCKRFYIRGSRI